MNVTLFSLQLETSPLDATKDLITLLKNSEIGPDLKLKNVHSYVELSRKKP